MKYPYFSYSSETGLDTHATEEDARKAAEELLEEYRIEAGDGWSDEVESICWGEIRQITKITHREPAPEGSEFDEIIDYGLTHD